MWILILVIGGIGKDVQMTSMTGDQCRQAVIELLPYERNMQAACVGPNGESFTTEDAAVDSRDRQ